MINRIASKALVKAKKLPIKQKMTSVSGVKRLAVNVLADALNSSKIQDVSNFKNSKTLAKNFIDFFDFKLIKKNKKRISGSFPITKKKFTNVNNFVKKHFDDLVEVTKKKNNKLISSTDISDLKRLAGKLIQEFKFPKIKSKFEYLTKVIQPFIDEEKRVLNCKILKNYKLQKIDYKSATKKYDKALAAYMKILLSGDKFKIDLAKTYLDTAKYNKEIALKYLNKAKDMASEI